jgi:hypothetical protein
MTSRVGSGGGAGGVDRLHPAMRAHMWKPGQSGNPSGHSGDYGEAITLAQQAAPDAVRPYRALRLPMAPAAWLAVFALRHNFCLPQKLHSTRFQFVTNNVNRLPAINPW